MTRWTLVLGGLSAGGAFVIGLVLSDAMFGLLPPRLSPTQAALDPQQSGGHRFRSDAGMMVKFIKPDKTAAFEVVISKLQKALTQSRNTERRQQAQSWRVFRAVEPATNGDAVYVFEMDPAVRGADYAVAKILAEAFPGEAQSLYRQYADAMSSRQYVVDLTLVAAFGEASPK
jgi:hypothetical protein